MPGMGSQSVDREITRAPASIALPGLWPIAVPSSGERRYCSVACSSGAVRQSLSKHGREPNSRTTVHLSARSAVVMAITKCLIETHKFGALLNRQIVGPTDGQDVRSHPTRTKERGS
jgi:hypothetical protein